MDLTGKMKVWVILCSFWRLGAGAGSTESTALPLQFLEDACFLGFFLESL